MLFPENEEKFAPPPCGFLIGIYLFYENWSTETFRKSQRGGLFVRRKRMVRSCNRTQAERKFVEDLIIYLDYKIREAERIRTV
jgi:hypothetical protein